MTIGDIFLGFEKAVELLIGKGVDLNAKNLNAANDNGDTALKMAVEKGIK